MNWLYELTPSGVWVFGRRTLWDELRAVVVAAVSMPAMSASSAASLLVLIGGEFSVGEGGGSVAVGGDVDGAVLVVVVATSAIVPKFRVGISTLMTTGTSPSSLDFMRRWLKLFTTPVWLLGGWR